MAIEKISKLFGSRVRTKVLAWFCTHMDTPSFVRQIASFIGEDPTNVSRELAGLEDLGILKSKRLGNLKQFQVNPECHFLNELKGLMLKTSGVGGQIRDALEKLTGIEGAFLYGPFAEGKERAGSEVNLIIIGDVDLKRLDSMLKNLEVKTGREINYVFYNRMEFKSQRAAQEPFLSSILKSAKLMLVGAEEALGAA